ncbi:MAG: hypothetical protein AAB443_00310 [Patescibacteria group bacterium]
MQCNHTHIDKVILYKEILSNFLMTGKNLFPSSSLPDTKDNLKISIKLLLTEELKKAEKDVEWKIIDMYQTMYINIPSFIPDIELVKVDRTDCENLTPENYDQFKSYLTKFNVVNKQILELTKELWKFMETFENGREFVQDIRRRL